MIWLRLAGAELATTTLEAALAAIDIAVSRLESASASVTALVTKLTLQVAELKAAATNVDPAIIARIDAVSSTLELFGAGQ